MAESAKHHPDHDFELPQTPDLTIAEALLTQLASSSFLLEGAAGEFIQAFFAQRAKPTGRPNLEERYKALVEQIPAVIFTAFLDEGVSEAYVSPHIETVLGFTQEEWLNDPVRWYQHIHPDDRNRWNIEAAQLVLSGKPLRAVYRVLARDGRVVWFHCQVKMIRHDDGRPWFIHGTGFDITELKQAEMALKTAHDELETRVHERTAELAKANADLKLEIVERARAQAALAQKAEELARMNVDLEQFAFSASHDLQEPLRNIAVYSQLLKDRYRGKLDSRADEVISILSEGAQRMALMISDLHRYTKAAIESEQMHELVDADLILENSLESLRVIIRDSHAVITHDLLPSIEIRGIHLQQIFQNLISNAIKYRSGEAPHIHVSAAPRDGRCIISVEDNGIGIAPEYHEKIFGIFKRLHSRDQYSGSGIGLAICKRIVERYGGRIWVESDGRRGAAFRFTLPVTENCTENK